MAASTGVIIAFILSFTHHVESGEYNQVLNDCLLDAS